MARLAWWHRKRGRRMRRCANCGYTWEMPRKEPKRGGHTTEGIELTPHLQSAARLIGQQISAEIEEEAEVRTALSHCPQCGSGHFTEYRAEQTAT